MAFYRKRVGIETLTQAEEQYWRNQNVNYRPILEYKPLTQAEEQRLRTEYYTNNNRVGYEKLYYAVRQPNGQTSTGKDQFSPTIRQVQAWLSQQTVAQDYKPVQRPKDTKPIIVSKTNDLMQMDYMVMTSDLRYNGYKHILTCIDVLSKRAYARTIRLGVGHDPTAAQTLTMAESIFTQVAQHEGSRPKRLQTDNGAHFLAEFEQSFVPGGRLHGIKYASGLRYRATSQSVIERFHRTLRNMIRRMHAGGDRDWPSKLQQLIDNYNKNQHSVLRMAPNDADNSNLDEAKQRIKDRAIMRNHNSMALEVGDKVRLVNFKKMKDSKYKDEPNWWPEVYEIFHVVQPSNPTHPRRYILEPNPPTTIVGNRPGYRGPLARGRRQFSVYELLILARKGEEHWDKIKTSTEIEVLNKIESDDDDDDDDASAQAAAQAKGKGKGTPGNGQKQSAAAAANAGQPVRKSTRAQKDKQPQDLVGKAIMVKWDADGPLTKDHIAKHGDKGTFYKANVSSYDPDTGRHKVQYVSDKVIAEHNLVHPRKPDFIPPGFWKISA
jgi:hypothetical protein